MNRYTVVWVKSAQDELANLWLNATDRNSLTTAANLIERQLSTDASATGTELSEGLRLIFESPLKAIFAVQEEDRIADVLRVRSI